MLTGGELFAGIGGFTLAMEMAGIQPVYAVEIDESCQETLRLRHPSLEVFGDVRGVGAGTLPRVDIIAGGFPCQPVSNAGKRKGRDDIRWLWPEFARIVRELRPRYVVVENVAALIGRGFQEVQEDLAALGYDTEWDCLPASAFGAPHDRDRLFLVAYAPRVEHEVGSSSDGRPAAPLISLADAKGERGALRQATPQLVGGSSGGGQAVADTDREGQLQQGRSVGEVGGRTLDGGASLEDANGSPVDLRRRRWRVTEAGELIGWGSWATEPGVGRMAHGVPDRLDRLTKLGNALVPQVAAYIFRKIVEAEERVA